MRKLHAVVLELFLNILNGPGLFQASSENSSRTNIRECFSKPGDLKAPRELSTVLENTLSTMNVS